MIISDSTSSDQLDSIDKMGVSEQIENSTDNDALDACIGVQSQEIAEIPQGSNTPVYDEEPELARPTFSDIPPKATQSAKKSQQQNQDKENTNITQMQPSQSSSYMHKSTSEINYQQMNEDENGNDNLDSSDYKESNQSSIRASQKKKAKRSQSKDPKIMQTMKAYFPGLNQVKEQKKSIFPQSNAPKQLVYGTRSSTQGSSSNKAQVYNERIIFVEDSRKSQKKNAPNQQKEERRNSNLQNANGSSIKASTHQSSNSQSYRKNVTQLPPIDKKSSNVEILDQQRSPRMSSNVLSPISNIEKIGDTHFPDTQRPNLQMHQSWSAKRQQEENIMVIGISNEEENQQRKVDFEKKNQDLILKMQQKKIVEQKMMEEQRRKAIKKQEKLKKLILQQAADHREKKNNIQNQQQQTPNQTKTPTKRKANSQPPAEGEQDEGDDEKKKHDMMKKFYRNRYASFLKAIQDQNKKKEQDIEGIKKAEEKKKAKLKEEIGFSNVQSRFMEDVSKMNKEAAEMREKVLVEEVANKGKKDKPKRGSSTAAMKTMTSTTSFSTAAKTDQSVDVIKIYQQSMNPTKRDNSRSLKRALTPKVKKSKKVIVMGNQIVDEKDEEELIKEQKAKKEAAEKIRQRQQKYLQDLQDKKEKEIKQQEEEKKKQDKSKQWAREQAKQNFEKLQNQPGLKELQEKQDKKSDDEEDKSNIESTQKKKAKKSKVPESGIEAFIERNNPKRTTFPNITDMTLWKKKFKVDEATKVFICTGGYPDIKKALKSRGWVHNKDATSPCFDLKWVLKAKDIDHNTINDSQLVNHFNKAAAITTKVGLCHNLKNLIWFNNVDIDTFYPRCFDLAIQEELEDYIQEFKAVKAETYVKTFVRQMRESTGDKTTVADKVLKVALKVCEKRLKDLDDLIDDPNAFLSLVTDDEWKVLGADELNVETLAQKKHEDWMLKNEVMKKQREKEEKAKNKKKKKKKTKPQDEEKKEEVKEDEAKEEEEEPEDTDADQQIAAKQPEFKRAIKILEELKKKFPQYGLNGEDNIWIIKPAGLSRGRGIVLYKQLVEILDLVKSKESQYIAQKYIENTMIVKKRKFDIRQWVLVTDWNPLTIWLYKEPYFRFPASDYNADDIMNLFVHLTNNSIGKYAESPNASIEIPGNMMDFQEFSSYLQEQYGWDVWEDKLLEQTKNIVINTLESVQDNFECKKGCFELFGYDLMIDDEFNMWLIEVNSSPAMDYSTDVTARLVKMVLEDCIKVVVDHAGAKKKSKVDTGSFECIYKAKRIVDRPMQSFGLNLVCEGKKIAPNKLANY